MRKNTIILLATSLLITACSNNKSVTTPNQERGVIQPTQKATKPLPEQVREIPNISEDTAVAIPLVAEPATPQIDVIERIRRGFKFPDVESKYTDDYIKWSVKHSTYLTDLLARAEPFLYYIVEEIDKRQLPMELALLPVIESAYKPNAISSSKASGLWQFIPSTGRSFGLNQDWWYDGRRDFIKSTNAALDYLTQLNKLFDGDWHLTLAAYNAGQGTISRAIRDNKRKGKPALYQDLNLRAETTKYLPKLQAIKEIIKNPAQYNATLAKIANQPYFEIISLPGQVDLRNFAELAKLDIEQVRHLNAGHLRWATSPTPPYQLLMPLSNHIQSRIALQEIKVNPTIEYQKHTISRGETLSQIAQRYSVNVSALQNVNKLNGTNIGTGKTLMIPIASGSVAPTANTYSSDSNAKNSNTNNKLVHRVVKGDTLWSISKRYNVALNQLLSLNKLSKNHILSLNQALLIFSN